MRDAVTRLAGRVLNRAARELVTRGVPPRLTGYRYLKTASPFEYEYELIDPPCVSHVPLPCNVSSREELSRERRRWGLSFYDVPERPVRETYVATVPECRVFTDFDEWGEPYYAIFAGDRELQVRGTGYNRRIHRRIVSSRASSVTTVPKAAWILEQWDRNYSHWLLWHMVKLALLRDARPDETVILPSGSRLAPVIARSLAMLGMSNVLELPSTVFDVGELTVLGIDDFRDSLLRQLRSALALRFDDRPRRRIFISRARSKWRRLQNEDEVWSLLRSYGYERVVMEDLSFDEQVELMSGAAAVFGLHGAGLANIIFAPEDIDVIEISPVDFPDPHFYALASALGQRYWLLHGAAAGVRQAGYDDIVADIREVKGVLERIERRPAS